MKSKYIHAVIITIILFSILAIAGYFVPGPANASPTSRNEAPAFTLPGLSGKDIKLADLRGKVVFLNFFAHWCPPCRSEMPSMQSLYNKLKGKNFEMVAVAVESSPKKDTLELIRKGGYTFTVLLDRDGSVSEKYGIRSIPATFIIDKKGRIVFKEVGSRDWSAEDIVKELKGLMR